MSRTYRGGKSPGYEYWSRRPNASGAVGKIAKKQIHRIERQQNKREAKQFKE